MPPKLASAVETALLVAENLKTAGAANEANTKVHVVEPVLAALGWNLLDFNEVDREFKVFDGTFLDYALRVNGTPKLFVEAKALGKTLSDKQFIAQTVNYANNEGVVWCVLTNGLVYQVYKSNEPVVMDRKLLFEVDVRDAADESRRGDVIAALETIAREAVAAGRLDEWGEAVFTDIRVRTALAKLASDPPSPVLKAVAAAMEGPPLPQARLRTSVGRLLEQAGASSGGQPVVGVPPDAKPAKPATTSPKQQKPKKVFEVAHHTANKPASIVDLFEKIDAFALALGPDVERRPTKMYIGYFAGKRSFFTLELQKARAYAYISLPPSDVKPWDENEMRDVTTIGHFGMGDLEFTVRSPEQLQRLEPLLRSSYLRNRK